MLHGGKVLLTDAGVSPFGSERRNVAFVDEALHHFWNGQVLEAFGLLGELEHFLSICHPLVVGEASFVI